MQRAKHGSSTKAVDNRIIQKIARFSREFAASAANH